jgi:hypothetical protein
MENGEWRIFYGCWILNFEFWIAVSVALQRFVQIGAKGDPTPS